MKKILKVLIVLIIIAIINSVLVYFFSVALENSPEAYPQTARLSEIFKGNSEKLTIEDFEINNWANEKGDGVSATDLPDEILKYEFQKCNKWETVLICMLQNRFNSKLNFEPYIIESGTLYDRTISVDYLRVFGNDYVVAMYANDELFDEYLSTVFVVYKSTDDIYSELKEFETEKEHFLKVYPWALSAPFISKKVEIAIRVLVIAEFVVLIVFIKKIYQKSEQSKCETKKQK